MQKCSRQTNVKIWRSTANIKEQCTRLEATVELHRLPTTNNI